MGLRSTGSYDGLRRRNGEGQVGDTRRLLGMTAWAALRASQVHAIGSFVLDSCAGFSMERFSVCPPPQGYQVEFKLCIPENLSRWIGSGIEVPYFLRQILRLHGRDARLAALHGALNVNWVWHPSLEPTAFLKIPRIVNLCNF